MIFLTHSQKSRKKIFLKMIISTSFFLLNFSTKLISSFANFSKKNSSFLLNARSELKLLFKLFSFSFHSLDVIFIPSMMENFQATPTKSFHFSSFLLYQERRYHHHWCKASKQYYPTHYPLTYTTLNFTRPSHILLCVQCDFVLSYERKILLVRSRLFRPCRLHALEKNNTHSFPRMILSCHCWQSFEADIQFFSKQRPRSFTYSVLLPYFRRSWRKKLFFLSS
jgi:hypothetical protein